MSEQPTVLVPTASGEDPSAAAAEEEEKEDFKLVIQCSTSLERAVQYLHQHKDGSILLEFRKGTTRANPASLTDEKLQTLLDAISITLVKIRQVTINPVFVEQFASLIKQIQFYRAIGGISSLLVLKWRVNNPLRHVSCLQPLTHLLDASRNGGSNLETLDCHGACFIADFDDGGVQDFHNFANALQYHPKLRIIKFFDCQLRNKLPCYVQPVLSAFGTIPKLEHLELSIWTPDMMYFGSLNLANQTWTPAFQTVSQLCHRGPYNLQTLHFQNSLGNGICQSIVYNALKTSRNITNLVLPIHLNTNSKDCTLLGEVLTTNQVLRSLKIKIISIDNKPSNSSNADNENQQQNQEKEVEEPILKLISALKVNTTLTSLELDCFTTATTNNNNSGVYIPNLTTTTSSGVYIPNQKTKLAILTMLQQNKNTTLVKLDFGSAPALSPHKWEFVQHQGEEGGNEGKKGCSFLQQVQFYLELNRMGRKELLLQYGSLDNDDDNNNNNTRNCRQQWIDVLIKATTTSKFSVSAICYFLLQNPSLCDLTTSNPSTTTSASTSSTPATPCTSELQESEEASSPTKKQKTAD